MEKKVLAPTMLAHLNKIAHDGMDIFMLENGTVRGAILNASRLVNEMRANHHLGILESLTLSHAAMGGVLCTNQLKDSDRLTLSLECSGSLKGFSIDASADGWVRGYLKVDTIPLEAPPESFDLSPYIGEGTFSVTKTNADNNQPFTGTIELAGESIAGELTRYFLLSEQIQTAISLSVSFDVEGCIRGAGGLFLQALPGTDPQILEDLELWIHEIPSIGKSLADGSTGSHILHQHFGAFSPEIIGSRAAEFHCSCERQRYAEYLSILSPEDRQALREHNPEFIHVTCHNCNTVYLFPHNEI